jgi:heptosyltransferase-2
MQRFLIIQTAFLGDAILATSVAEKIHQEFPHAEIFMLVRKGNESLFAGHPFLNVLVWNKKDGKFRSLFKIIREVRKLKFDYVINLHRFASSGIITALSGAGYTAGFDKNPLSLFFKKKVKHIIGDGRHEVERNQSLIDEITGTGYVMPKLYPSETDHDFVQQLVTGKFVCMAPASVWFTKQLPGEKWISMIEKSDPEILVCLIGAATDKNLCEELIRESGRKNVLNLAGRLQLLQTAALMKKAVMNYVNDSGPLHLATAVNAPVTAFFCSTIPAFGFGPLSDNSIIIETRELLTCKPCGLHGYDKCPLGHFRCGHTIEVPLIKF